MNPVVIIVTYNGMQWLEKCLNSIEQSDIELDTIVIDNGSTDGSVNFVNDSFPSITLIRSKSNLGFGKANNLGLKEAIRRGAEYVYLMNQDAWVDSNTISGLIDEMKKNPNYGILSPIQLTGKGDAMDFNFSKFTATQVLGNAFIKDSDNDDLKPTYEVPFVMAAHWLINVSSLKLVGGFSHAFPHYGEDHNLIHRFRYFGYNVGICPYYRAYHDREFRTRSLEKIAYNAGVILAVKLNDVNNKGLNYGFKAYLYFLRYLIGQTKFRVDLIASTIFNSFGIIKKASIYKKITMKEKGCFI